MFMRADAFFDVRDIFARRARGQALGMTRAQRAVSARMNLANSSRVVGATSNPSSSALTAPRFARTIHELVDRAEVIHEHN